jgi:hypothetical protein
MFLLISPKNFSTTSAAQSREWQQSTTVPHDIEKILNHVTGTISGVAAIYNRFKYQDEMREAIKL